MLEGRELQRKADYVLYAFELDVSQPESIYAVRENRWELSWKLPVKTSERQLERTLERYIDLVFEGREWRWSSVDDLAESVDPGRARSLLPNREPLDVLGYTAAGVIAMRQQIKKMLLASQLYPSEYLRLAQTRPSATHECTVTELPFAHFYVFCFVSSNAYAVEAKDEVEELNRNTSTSRCHDVLNGNVGAFPRWGGRREDVT